MKTLVNHLIIAILPLVAAALLAVAIYYLMTFPVAVEPEGIQAMGFVAEGEGSAEYGQELTAAEEEGGLEEPEEAGDAKEPQAKTVEEATVAAAPTAESAKVPPAVAKPAPGAAATAEAKPGRTPAPLGYWITLGIVVAGLAAFYVIFTFERLEIFKMLLGSFFTMALIILGVLGTIVVDLATPTEAAAMGSAVSFWRPRINSSTSGWSKNRSSSPQRPRPWCAGSSSDRSFSPRRSHSSAGRRSSISLCCLSI